MTAITFEPPRGPMDESCVRLRNMSVPSRGGNYRVSGPVGRLGIQHTEEGDVMGHLP
jgi:hypothetical protein